MTSVADVSEIDHEEAHAMLSPHVFRCPACHGGGVVPFGLRTVRDCGRCNGTGNLAVPDLAGLRRLLARIEVASAVAYELKRGNPYLHGRADFARDLAVELAAELERIETAAKGVPVEAEEELVDLGPA